MTTVLTPADLASEYPNVPSKCRFPAAAGSPEHLCPKPGALPRCALCPASPTYWRRTEGANR